jgi:hypothetical protein
MFDQHLDLLTEEALNDRRALNMGDLNLNEVVKVLEVLREDLVQGNTLKPEQVSETVFNNVAGTQFRDQILNLLKAMQDYGPTTQNPTQERTNLLAQAKDLRDQALTQLRPLLRPPIEEATKTLAELESMRVTLAATTAELEDRVAELTKQQEAVASKSGQAATGELAKQYKQQADEHMKAAKVLLRFAIGTGVALALLICLTFWWLAPETNDMTEFIRQSALRLLLLSVATVALVFCLRNYRVNKHLEVLNERRENALETFGLFQGAVTSEDARNYVVQELVRAVFAHEDTGYVQADTERTVIESPTGMLSALAAARGRDGTG